MWERFGNSARLSQRGTKAGLRRKKPRDRYDVTVPLARAIMGVTGTPPRRSNTVRLYATRNEKFQEAGT